MISPTQEMPQMAKYLGLETAKHFVKGFSGEDAKFGLGGGG